MASATADVDNAQMDSVDDIKITNWICVPVSQPATLITGSRTHSGLYQHESDHNMTNFLSESRSVRIVLYSSTPVESEHRFWIDPEVTFGGVAKALAEMYPSQESVVLQANWGPRPYWTESHPDSLIGSTCRVLYAILKDQAKPYTMGVVRTSLSDYPIPIYVPASKSSTTLLEAVIASCPKLTGQVKSIVLHPGDHDLQDDPWEFPQGQPYPAAPLFITTLDEPSKEFLASSLYEAFSPLSPKASTSSDSDGLIPPLLQISFAECKLLVQRAYDLDAFPLQMIHLSEAIFHVIISLARSLAPVFESSSSSIGDVLSAEDDLADHLRVAPLLCQQLEELLNAANGIMDNLESGGFNSEAAQDAIEKVFATLCGDLPGALTVRCSENDFKKFSSIDCQELGTLPIDTHTKSVEAAYLDFIMEDRRVANLNPMMDLDYHSDAGKPPDPSSELDLRFPSGKEGLSEPASTLWYPDSVEANPAAVLGAHNMHQGVPRDSNSLDNTSDITMESAMNSQIQSGHANASVLHQTRNLYSVGASEHGPSNAYGNAREEELQAPENQVPPASNLGRRLARLDEGAARMIKYHSGTKPDAPISLLEALEDHYKRFPNTPVVNIYRKPSSNGRKGAMDDVTCGICSESGKFQKIADHIVCEHFKLTLWYCGWNSCPALMSRKSDLDRHRRVVHNITRPSETKEERRPPVGFPYSPPIPSLSPGPGSRRYNRRRSRSIEISSPSSYSLGDIVNRQNDNTLHVEYQRYLASHQEAKGRISTGRPLVFGGGVYPTLVHPGTALPTDRAPSLRDENSRLFYPTHFRNSSYGLGIGTSSDSISLSEQNAASTSLPSTPNLQVEPLHAFDGYSPSDFLSPPPHTSAASSSGIELLPLPQSVHRVTTPIQSESVQLGIYHASNLPEDLPLPPSSPHCPLIRESSQGPMESYPTLPPQYYPPRAQINMPNAVPVGSLPAGHRRPALDSPPSRSYTPYPVDEDFAFNLSATDALFSYHTPEALLPFVDSESAFSALDVGNHSLPQAENDVDSELPDATVSGDEPKK